MATAQPKYLEFQPEDKYHTNKKNHRTWIFSHIWRQKFLFFALLIIQIIWGTAQSSIPGYISDIFGLFQAGTLTTETLKRPAFFILFFGVVQGVFVLIRSSTAQLIGERLERDTRDELYTELLGKSLTFHDKQQIGDLMSRAATDVRMLNLAINPGWNLVSTSLIGIIIPLVFIYLIHPYLLLVPVLFLISYGFVLRKYNNDLSPWTYKERTTTSRINARLNETLEGISVVRGVAQEDRERHIFNKNIEDYRTAQVNIGKIQARYYPILLLGLFTALGILHGAILVQSGVITIEGLIEFILLLNLLRFPTFINNFAFTALTMGFSSAKRIFDLMTGESTIADNTNGYAAPVKGHIRFDHVTFGYTGNIPILRDLSFEILPGQTVAIVGMTGSGKTTITKLLSRLYDPQEGQILIDDVPLPDWSLSSLRGQMAVVEQDIFLFSRTISENIAFGLENVSQERIEWAAKLARAHRFITEELSDGYDTITGERGLTLSGGQRQRIAIARAIIRDPKILILDDASSAIDSKTENEINLAIKEVLQDRIAFLITHRIAQIRRADLIILLDKGRIVAKGNHQEMMLNSPKYRAIFSTLDTTTNVATGGDS